MVKWFSFQLEKQKHRIVIKNNFLIMITKIQIYSGLFRDSLLLKRLNFSFWAENNKVITDYDDFIWKAVLCSQSDSDAAVKLEFDDDGLGAEAETGENSVTKPKAPRVKKEKKEPGEYLLFYMLRFIYRLFHFPFGKQSGVYCVTGAPRVKKPPAPKAASAKKVKKRNPWSDDELKSDSDMENSEPVIPRETKSQRASGTSVVGFLSFSN